MKPPGSINGPAFFNCRLYRMNVQSVDESRYFLLFFLQQLPWTKEKDHGTYRKT